MMGHKNTLLDSLVLVYLKFEENRQFGSETTTSSKN